MPSKCWRRQGPVICYRKWLLCERASAVRLLLVLQTLCDDPPSHRIASEFVMLFGLGYVCYASLYTSLTICLQEARQLLPDVTVGSLVELVVVSMMVKVMLIGMVMAT